MRVFLGGTCANTSWRDDLIPYLKQSGIDYFNPVVVDWTLECQQIEEDEKKNKCDCHLYVITKEMLGTYSIAEAIHSAHLANMYGTTVDFIIFAVLDEGTWQTHNRKSFNAVMNLIRNIAPYNSVTCYVANMEELARYFTGPGGC